MPDIISKLLRASIWSRCAESEKTPFSRTGRRFTSAALHRIRFGTCCFLPMSYLNSETNKRSKDGAKRLALLWSATTSSRFHQKFHSAWKKRDLSRPEIYKSLKPCWLSKWARIARVVARFPQASRVCPTIITPKGLKELEAIFFISDLQGQLGWHRMVTAVLGPSTASATVKNWICFPCFESLHDSHLVQ